MPNIFVLSDYGSFPQSVIGIVSATQQVLARIITSDIGTRSNITKLAACPLPGEALPAGSVWLFSYFIVRTKMSVTQVNLLAQQGQLNCFNAAFTDVGDVSRLGNTYELLFERKAQWGSQEFSWDFGERDIFCENGSTLIVGAPMSTRMDPSTAIYTTEAANHFETLTVCGRQDAIPPGLIGRSVPRSDL